MKADFDVLGWDEVEPVGKQIFNLWAGGSDLQWAEHVWDALAHANLTQYATELERSVCVLRLITLGALYREFHVRASEEGEAGDWRYEITADLVGDYPLLDAFTIGQLAELRGIHVDNSPYASEDVLGEVLQGIALQEHGAVVRALREQWSEAEIFAGLYVSTRKDVTYPVPDNLARGIVNNDVTGSKLMAWDWLSSGLPLDFTPSR